MSELSEVILESALQAAHTLFKVGVAFVVYEFGKIASQHLLPKFRCYRTMIGIAAFLGFLS